MAINGRGRRPASRGSQWSTLKLNGGEIAGTSAITAAMMYHGEGITVSLAGLPIHVDCEPEHVDYCLRLTSRIEPRARNILEAAPDIGLTELLFLLALSLADEIYGREGSQTEVPPAEDRQPGGEAEDAPPEQRALNAVFYRLRP